MTQTIVPPGLDVDDAAPEDAARRDILVGGRPVEDRSFEAVEAGAGLMAGLLVGTVVAGPVGTAVGGLIGAAAGIAAGEALERHEGRAATTTDAHEG